MTRYVKKRIPIEAVHFNPSNGPENPNYPRPGGDIDEKWQELREFTGGQVQWTSALETDDGVTLYEVYDYLHETWVKFYEGDWIIKGAEGEFYPHNGELFPKVYEEWDENENPDL